MRGDAMGYSASTLARPTTALTRQERAARQLGRLCVHVVLVGVGFFFALPLFWLVSSSLKDSTEIFRVPPTFIPTRLAWENYPGAFDAIPIPRYLGNTLGYVIVATIGAVFSNTIIAYGFSRIRWPGRDVVFILVLSTMMLPFQVRMIPLYVLFNRLDWLNTYLPLMVPTFFGNAFYIFLLRQFYLTLPFELSDAGRIDGCSEFDIFWRIVLPLMKPAVTTLALFEIIFAWNDFLGPLIYLRDQMNYTMSVGLRTFFTLYGAQWGYLMATATMFTLPEVVLVFFAQRTFIEGIALTGIKG